MNTKKRSVHNHKGENVININQNMNKRTSVPSTVNQVRCYLAKLDSFKEKISIRKKVKDNFMKASKERLYFILRCLNEQTF